MNSVQVLHPAETGSHRLINGEYPAVILVQVRDHSNRHAYFNSWLHKHKVLANFETATETIML